QQAQQANQPQYSATAQQFILSGMTCASCVASVEQAINSVSGVQQANVNLAERTALVSGAASAEMIIQAITDAGYGAELSEDEQTRRQRQQQQNEQSFRQHIRHSVIALIAGGAMMAWGMFGGSMMINSPQDQLGWGAVGLLTLLLLLTVGRHFFINAWKAFKHHRATMDTLVALGTGSAWLYSMLAVLAPEILPAQARHVYFEASAMILGLITLGHALEARARSRTSKALEQLMDLQPQTAVIIENGEEREVPLADVKAGMQLRLYPGAKVPVDGTIIDGQSYIDESMLTGEPIPANKQQGDQLHAGTINQNGSLIFKAEKIGHDTMLARIIDLVRQAQSSKPALARLADTISGIFVPTVMIIAIVTAMV
ncbi:HAD-IC family P-type ATPase, partial [Photobacterium sanctipauli]